MRGDVEPTDPVGIVVHPPAREPRRGVGCAPRALRELVAALGLFAELRGERLEGGVQSVERRSEIRPAKRFGLRLLAGRLARREPHAAQRLREGARSIGQRCIVARDLQALKLGIAGELAQLARRDLLAEEQRRRFGQLMRLIENHRVAPRQEIREALVLQHDVGKEQVVVDHHDVGGEGVLACFHDEAIAVTRTFAAEAVLARGRYLPPEGGVVWNVGQLGLVTAHRGASERLDSLQIAHVGP